jgi:hypothetical protein
MPDITTQIKTAITEEPPLGFGPAEVIAAAHRVRHRRRVTAATAVGAAAAVAVGTVLALPGGTATSTPTASTGGGTAKLTLTALNHMATKRSAAAPGVPSGGARVDGVNAAGVFLLFEKDTGTNVVSTTASLLQPAEDLDLGAGLAVPGHPYLNIQVTGPFSTITAMPNCAELSDLASGSGDGYYGPCSIQRLADGSILIVRSGETRQGHLTMAQASLIEPNGSAVFAEDTNQTFLTTEQIVKLKEAGDKTMPPTVTTNPPVSASALADFVRDVIAQS